MKLTRKLIPAFAMLLIAAVMMSTASFAWFSMSTEVTANGMTVTAKTPASLEISADNVAWSYSVSPSTSSATNLMPITYYDSTDKNEKDGWYVPGTDNKISKDGKVETGKELKDENIDRADGKSYWTKVDLSYETGKAGETTYALVGKLYLRTNDGAANSSAVAIKFDAQATVNGTSGLTNGVMVYIWDGAAVYDITTSKNSPVGGWEAPITESKVLTVVVVYNGENDVIKNDNADTVSTSIEITFNEYN